MPVTTIAVLGFWNVNAPTYSTTIRVQSNSEQIPWSISPSLLSEHVKHRPLPGSIEFVAPIELNDYVLQPYLKSAE